MTLKSRELNDGQTEKPSKEEGNPGVKMIPESEIEKRVDELLTAKLKNLKSSEGTISQDLVEALVELAKNNSDNQKKNQKYDPMQYRDPDPKDRLEEPKVFWSHGVIMVLGDDRRDGQPFPAPYGPVVFKPVATDKKQVGKEVNLIIFNKYICQSKKELDFLMNHSLFNVVFFERVNEIQSTDVRYALTLARYIGSLRATSAIQIFDQAKQMGIPRETDSVDQMRVIIAQKMAKDTIAAEDEAAKTRIRTERKEAALVGQKQY